MTLISTRLASYFSVSQNRYSKIVSQRLFLLLAGSRKMLLMFMLIIFMPANPSRNSCVRNNMVIAPVATTGLGCSFHTEQFMYLRCLANSVKKLTKLLPEHEHFIVYFVEILVSEDDLYDKKLGKCLICAVMFAPGDDVFLIIIYSLSTLFAKAKLDEGFAHNFDCDISKPRRTGYINFTVT